jgi:hypothetical protein
MITEGASVAINVIGEVFIREGDEVLIPAQSYGAYGNTAKRFKGFCVLGGLASSVCGVAQERPNIIVFLVDDMGLMDTSVPFIADESGQPVRHPLNDWYHTPNMERLAKQGGILFLSLSYLPVYQDPLR